MMTPFTIPIPTYQCHKRVQALRIKAVVGNPRGWELHFENARFCPVDVPHGWMARHLTGDNGASQLIGGYAVWYEDGYMSWSPAAAFEAGYTLVETADGAVRSSDFEPKTAPEAYLQKEIERLRGLLCGCVEHMEYSTPQGCAAWDAANEEVGPSTQPTRSHPQPTTHLQTCPHCKAVFLADGVTTKE